MGDETAVAMATKVTRGNTSIDEIVYDFKFQTYGQIKLNGCWLSSFRMIYQWASENGMPKRTPDGVDKRLIDSVFHDQATLDAKQLNGLVADERISTRAALGLTGMSGAEVAKLGIGAFLDLLDTNGPMVITIKLKQGSGFIHHAMVVRGGQYHWGGPQQLYCLNPFDEEAINLQKSEGEVKKWPINWDMWTGQLIPDPDIQHVLSWLGKANDG
jgi:hypothetical protein